MTLKKCTIVMYHYVRNMHETEYPTIKGLLIDKFKGQINYLNKNYSIIDIHDYVDFLDNNKDIPKNSAILSFDDGFKDHYTAVFPILKEMRLPACFYPITDPLVNHTVPAVHKTHFLLAKIGIKKFAEEFNQTLESYYPKLLKDFLVDNMVKSDIVYRFDDPLTTNLKYNISVMPSKIRKELINHIFSKFFIDEKEFCDELYMNWDEIKEMREEGMVFGAQTKTHPRLSKLSREEQFSEIKESKDILEKNLKCNITSFSYPYGNYNDTTIKILDELKFNCALTVKPIVNEGRVNSFEICRLDTNQLPFE